ncbi:MAG TPA: beta-ketoacyl synthase N-terminal-like domain-containing protein, partial [Streptomyces sp.]
TAVELRNRLTAATGIALPATLIFDYATPAALADHLWDGVGATFEATPTASVAEDARDDVREQAQVDDPVVVIGMGCRFPGGADSPEALWELVLGGTDAVSGFPDDRGWDLETLGDPERFGGTHVGGGAFLYDAAEFDPAFFRISPREAVALDPQQRLLLETSWEAFERAGIDPHTLRGSLTGVFAGTNGQPYGTLLQRAPEQADGFLATGSAASIVSGRVSYTFGLEGPAMTVDTACSSSLVTLHLAVQALRAGECTLALAGGVTVMSTPDLFVEFARQGALSPDGRCRAFADSADGTGWGEGAGMLLLERLSDARRNGHPVLAVIRGSAVNQDGASNGLTAPNGPSQQRVIRAALANARLSTADVDAVEAHGTATTLGDPIEAQALLATYGQDREQPLYLGSLKSNIGHTQAAAGVAGVIKMIQAIRDGVLPRTLHVDAPSTKVDWTAGAVEVLTEARDWPSVDRPRRAAVSAFGVSGTNAHVILEQPPADADAPGGDGVVPVPLSAQTKGALREQAARLLSRLEADSELGLRDMAWTLATGRAAFAERAVLIGDRERLITRLREFASGSGVQGSSGTPGRTVFVFPGQGSQWVGMALELISGSPVFAQSMRECADALAEFTDWDLHEALADEDALRRVDVVQPATWAVMVSLAALWRSHGIEPDAVIGHSQGEIAAAHIAGALSLEDSARVVALRSQTIARGLAGKGGMVSVAFSGVEDLITRWDGRIEIAATNSPDNTVVAGEPDALDELLTVCETDGIRARRIPVDYASHTTHVEAVEHELTDQLLDVWSGPAEIPWFSTVDGDWLDGTEADGEYWYRNLRQPVGFRQAVERLVEEGYTSFIEVSPHPVLAMSVEDTVGRPVALGTLRRDEGGLDRFWTSVAEAWVRGLPVDWSRAFEGAPGRTVALPTYPFQRRSYWIDAPADTVAARARGAAGVAPEPVEEASRSRLADVPPGELLDAVRTLVRVETARALGYGSADDVDPDRGFFELGMTSVTSMDLRGRLSAATGLALPTAFVMDHPHPGTLAERLHALLVSDARSTADGVRGAGPVETLFRQAFAAGENPAGNEIIMSASLMRPVFTADQAETALPAPVRLAEGDGEPVLLCLPAVVATGGPQQYARLATEFRGRREVTVLPEPGFLEGELLPADLTALARLQAAAVRRAAGERPFVLLGHSAGGQIAHAVAVELEKQGTPAAGLVLLDVPWPLDPTEERAADAMLEVVFDREERLGGRVMDDHRLTAMGGYHRLMAAWRPTPLERTPALLVRATEPMVTADGDEVLLKVVWRLDHSVREVAGDHFTIVEEHAGATAEAVEEWLAGLFPES